MAIRIIINIPDRLHEVAESDHQKFIDDWVERQDIITIESARIAKIDDTPALMITPHFDVLEREAIDTELYESFCDYLNDWVLPVEVFSKITIDDFHFQVRLHDTVADDDKHIEVHAFYGTDDGQYAEIEGVIDGSFDSNTFINPAREEDRALLHDMLDAYLDACAKERPTYPGYVEPKD